MNKKKKQEIREKGKPFERMGRKVKGSKAEWL